MKNEFNEEYVKVNQNLESKEIDGSISQKNYEDRNKFKSGKWKEEEDQLLENYVSKYGSRNWKQISEKLKGRSPIQCLHRWTKILQPGLIKGPWTIEQDRKLIEWVKSQGVGNWSKCAEFLQGRSGKQCRERWFNTLNPCVKKGNWTHEEDFKIFDLYKKNGSKWTKIASNLEGRTENSIKNRFYSTLRRIANKKNPEKDINSLTLISKQKLVQYVDDALKEISMSTSINPHLVKVESDEIYFEKNFEIQDNSKDNKKNFLKEINLDNVGNSLEKLESTKEIKSKSKKKYSEDEINGLLNNGEFCELNPFKNEQFLGDQINDYIDNIFDCRKNEKNEIENILFTVDRKQSETKLFENPSKAWKRDEIRMMIRQLNELESLINETRCKIQMNDYS